MQKLDAQTYSGEQLAGGRDLRRREANLSEETEQRLAGFRGQCFEPAKLGGLQVAHLARDGQNCLNLSEGSPSDVEKLSVIAGSLATRTLGDVEGNAVTSSSELICQRSLLVLGESACNLDAFYREPLRVLPRLERVVDRHGATMQPSAIAAKPFCRMGDPIYATLFTAVRLCV